MQVERQVFRDTLTIEDIIYQFAVVIRHKNRMMAEMLILAIDPQVNKKQLME